MVKHIVMFRFKDDVGFNINPGEQWNICLNSEFRTLEDVIDYGKNPNHVKVAGQLKPYIAERSCVDYKTEQD